MAKEVFLFALANAACRYSGLHEETGSGTRTGLQRQQNTKRSRANQQWVRRLPNPYELCSKYGAENQVLRSTVAQCCKGWAAFPLTHVQHRR